MDIKNINQMNKVYFLPTGNRPIAPNHVTKIANSIRKWGVLRPLIVIETDVVDGTLKKYIVDGQHTYHALNRLNLDVPFIVCKKEFKSWKEIIKIISDLNTSSKGWVLKNFIESWATINDEYKTLATFLDRFDFEACFTASVLANKVTHHDTTVKIKNGTFVIHDVSKAENILSDLTDVFNEIGFRGNRWEIKYFCKEYFSFRTKVSNYNHQQFLIEVKKTAELYQFLDGEVDKLSEFFTKLIS